MLNEALSYVLYLYGLLYQAIVPCSVPELLPVDTINRQQYLGKWFFLAAVSHREADIQKFKVLDSILFTMEEPANDTLLLSGYMRMGENCKNQTWTYHLHPDRDDLELEARQSDVKPEVVTSFLKNSACHNMLASVRLPQTKEFCT
nr:PREDICTED: apolipoprotein M isoform X3 [Paralichthys olivaceus]